MKKRQLMAFGTIAAAAFTGIGLAAAGSADAGALPAQSNTAQQSIALATVDRGDATPQFITAAVDDVANAVGDAADDVADATADAAGDVYDATEQVYDEEYTSGAIHQASPVPAPGGAVSADAQFNVG
jgi:hypothetical protein